MMQKVTDFQLMLCNVLEIYSAGFLFWIMAGAKSWHEGSEKSQKGVRDAEISWQT
jgi:hypothetical protein